MTPILQILQNIIPAQDKLRAKLPRMARFGVIALLIVIAFIIFVFRAEFLMRYMIALLPIFYIVAVLSVGAKRALYGTAVFIFFCFALWVRVGPSYDAILGGQVVQFQGNDADYHMRLIENFVRNFPHRMAYEPYTLYPTGQEVQFAPFFDFLIALFIWIAGLGHPSALLIEKMGAYYPAILGSLTVIPVYFIGKEIFNNRNAGLLAAGLLAILPGEFLFRSLIGFTDHHIIETLLTTIAIMFLIMAIKRAQEIYPTFSNVKSREWAGLKKPLIFSTLSGVMFGLYVLSWTGGSLFVFIILAYFILQYILDHLHGKSTDYLLLIGIPVFLIPILMIAPFTGILVNSKLVLIALGIGAIAIALLNPLSRMMNRKNIKRIFYPIALMIIALVLGLIVYLAIPSLFKLLTEKFVYLVPSPGSLTIMEAQPFLGDLHRSIFFQHRVWQYFTTGIVLAGIAFLVMVYSAVKANKLAKWSFFSVVGIFLLTVIIWIFSFSASIYCRPMVITFLIESLIIVGIYCYCEKNSTRTLLIIWSVVILICLLAQTRFAYYFAVNIALLSCYVLWKIPSAIYKIFQIIGWKEALTQDSNVKALKKSRNKELEGKGSLNYFKPRLLVGFLSLTIIFFLTIYPNLLNGLHNQTEYPDSDCYKVNTAFCPSCSANLFLATHPYTPPQDWYDSMVWMKNNTPAPFGNDSFYYSLYDKPLAGQPYAYPDTAYGVMSWWDYGHWITRMAYRIPNANPFQSGIGGTSGPGPNASENPGASTFMTAQDEATGSAILDKLGSKYVVIDVETAISKYHTMVTWAGGNISDFYRIWYQDSNGEIISYNNLNLNQGADYQFFSPAYYKSMCARLYNFGATAAVPNNSTWAISYAEKADANGDKYKKLIGVANNGSPFGTYEDAMKFIGDHPEFTIVGLDPFRSPIPLEALNGYKLIYSSNSSVAQRGNRSLSYVEIFEYEDYK